MPDSTRSDCGYFGINQQECENENCCWDSDTPDVPWCFFKKSPQVNCDPDTHRQDCGYVGIDQSGCEKQGCCWNPAQDGSDTPWCYKPSGSQAPTVTPTNFPTHFPGDAPYNTTEMNKLKEFFFNNIDIGGTGAILASPSKQHPNYYYHWMRDAAITMNVVLKIGGDIGLQDNHVKNYISWVKQVQNAEKIHDNCDVLGEPKFFLNGKVYDGAWGRPQNDGPALRSLVLIRYAMRLNNGTEAEKQTVKNELWPMIQKDLNYVKDVWGQNCFDLWEEVNGRHFFTRYVQRCSLLLGAKLGDLLGEAKPDWNSNAGQIEDSLAAHWNPQTQIIEYAVNPPDHPKFHNIDVAVMLGALYGDPGYGKYTVEDPKVQSTVEAMIDVFNDGSYPIQNFDRDAGLPGHFIGRYPNDTYNGYDTSSTGNPWILATNALGEYYYRLAMGVVKKNIQNNTHTYNIHTHKNQGYFHIHFANLMNKHYRTNEYDSEDVKNWDIQKIAQSLTIMGDDQCSLVRNHIGGGQFHMSEQLNLDTGFVQGANDLTWSYGTIISAMAVRQELQNELQKLRERPTSKLFKKREFS